MRTKTPPLEKTVTQYRFYVTFIRQINYISDKLLVEEPWTDIEQRTHNIIIYYLKNIFIWMLDKIIKNNHQNYVNSV